MSSASKGKKAAVTAEPRWGAAHTTSENGGKKGGGGLGVGGAPATAQSAEEIEVEFLAQYDASKFERPSVAVDVALLTVAGDAIETVLLERAEPPHQGRFALPGSFVAMDESLDHAASRVLKEKAGLAGVFLEQLYTFGAPKRDPRTRVISVAYYALVSREQLGDAIEPHLVRLEIPWESETGGEVFAFSKTGKELTLAFDHATILGTAIKRIRGKLDYAPIGFQLLPERFTLLELLRVHEIVLGRPLNKDSFRRRMLASGQLEATGELQQNVEHRPAELYRFARRSAI
ncbi:MAG: NUDIX domain-containing protein [Polyangiaceae bacterium]